jgi:hypothetical protein
MRSGRLSSSLVLGLALLSAGIVPAKADVHPNTAPGFPGDHTFSVGDFDNVNLFNGSLTLTIPIGTSYPVNGGFSYNLKLVYNGNPWLFQKVTYQVPPDFHEVSRTAAFPNSCSNAGLGWRVSLGLFDPPCQVPDANEQLPGPIYQDENGTDHVFYATLHAGDPEDVPSPACRTCSTRATGAICASRSKPTAPVTSSFRMAPCAGSTRPSG